MMGGKINSRLLYVRSKILFEISVCMHVVCMCIIYNQCIHIHIKSSEKRVKRLPLNYKIMGNFNFYSLNNFINYFVPTKCFPFSLFVNMLYSVIRKEKQMFILKG